MAKALDILYQVAEDTGRELVEISQGEQKNLDKIKFLVGGQVYYLVAKKDKHLKLVTSDK